MKKEIIFLADGRDFHAIDWYKNIIKICSEKKVYLATDIFEAEGRGVLFDQGDNIIELFNISKFLFNGQSSFGNTWRNVIKVLFFPFQIVRIKRVAKNYPNAIFHAHTMYYLFLAWLAKIEYIGSPQGSEILVRPFRSRIYRYFAKKSLINAKHLIVDSESLRKGIKAISGRNADVIQYGIDVLNIKLEANLNQIRDGILSIRGWYPLYRISDIVQQRNDFFQSLPIKFIYPFYEKGYAKVISSLLTTNDEVLHRLPQKKDVYNLLSRTEIVISIPEKDSSPRSVYESIFCGCIVLATYNPWIDSLPDCMRERIIVVDVNIPNWLPLGIEKAKEILGSKYVASELALNMFDQDRSMLKVANMYYR